MIEIQQLVKRYPRSLHNALDGLTLTIPCGKIFGLLGPNGSGKTTLISILCGIISATSGSYTRLDRRIFGLVPQEIALYPNLTLVENLCFFGALYGLVGKDLENRIQEGMAMVGLSEVGHHLVQTYSGGMKRRANLLAGILHAPDVLFLDEPTVNVDPQSREHILANLQTLQKSGMTLIYTTHYLEEAAQLCQQIAIIDHGRILLEGEPRQLLATYPDCQNLNALFLQITGRRLRD